MSGFSDEDLARLKKQLKNPAMEQDGHDKWAALIARLEASEACIHRAIRDHGDLVVTTQFKSWEKAAGK